jgi:hypothetical protein
MMMLTNLQVLFLVFFSCRSEQYSDLDRRFNGRVNKHVILLEFPLKPSHIG